MEVVTKIFLCNLYEFLLFQRNEISYKISFLLHKYGVLRKFFASLRTVGETLDSYSFIYALHFKVVFLLNMVYGFADVLFLEFGGKSFSHCAHKTEGSILIYARFEGVNENE